MQSRHRSEHSHDIGQNSPDVGQNKCADSMRVMRSLLLLKLDIRCLLLLQSVDNCALRFVCGIQENVEIHFNKL